MGRDLPFAQRQCGELDLGRRRSLERTELPVVGRIACSLDAPAVGGASSAWVSLSAARKAAALTCRCRGLTESATSTARAMTGGTRGATSARGGGCLNARSRPSARRSPLLLAGLALHAGILVMHGLVSFSIAMMAALILYLRPSEMPFALSQQGTRLRRWLGSSRELAVAREPRRLRTPWERERPMTRVHFVSSTDLRSRNRKRPSGRRVVQNNGSRRGTGGASPLVNASVKGEP